MKKPCIVRIKIAAVACVVLGTTTALRAETTLRVGMALGDIPRTVSQPDQGGAGWRWVGVTLFDSLVNWDLTSADKTSGLIPGLATSWEADPADRRRWTFKLREGVKFHDGTSFDADAVIWNLDKLVKKDVPQYDLAQAAQTLGRLNGLESYRKIDAGTIELVTKAPDSMIPYYFARIFFASPARWKQTGSWAEFAKKPAGTGPWKLVNLVPRESAELVKNSDYWDPKRIPKTDRVMLLPIPDAITRTSALLSGQVDLIEAPAPDLAARLEAAGMTVIKNTYPHIWPWWLSQLDGSPFKDIRVRKAANLAIDRETLSKQLLRGFAQPAVGHAWPGHPWFGNPSFKIRYDLIEAKKLMAEAGYSKEKPVKAKVLITASGSGQMQPLPMNEFIQQSLAEIGLIVEFEVIEWNTMIPRRAAGAKAPINKGIHAINNSWAFWDPDFGFLIVLDSRRIAPAGSNWMNLRSSAIDNLVDRVRNEFDPVKQDSLVGNINAAAVDDAAWLYIVHDLNPYAMSPKVKDFHLAQHWIQDLTPVRVEK